MKFEEITSRGASLFRVSSEQFSNWRWQMKHQLGEAQDFEKIGGLTYLESQSFKELSRKFQSGVTPYYASLMQDSDDCPIRLQAIPRSQELFDPIGEKDPLFEVDHSPVKEVVHVYPDRVAFCVAQLCPVYCRYCFRKRRDEENGLHFNRQIIENGIAYIASQPAIRDVLITGGDPFIAHDHVLEDLLERLRNIPHVEIIRFGTRTPVTLPYRITDELCAILKKFHPIYVNTHFNCARELTAEAKAAVEKLVNAGIPVGNQSVFLRGVNDAFDSMLNLLKGLLAVRVKPYYLFHPHAVEGTDHLRPTLSEGMKLMRQLRGQITGFGIPAYIVDTPSGKVQVSEQSLLGFDGADALLATPRGEIWREKGVETFLQ